MRNMALLGFIGYPGTPNGTLGLREHSLNRIACHRHSDRKIRARGCRVVSANAQQTEKYEFDLPPAVGKALQKFTANEGRSHDEKRKQRLEALANFLLQNGVEHKQYPLAEYLAASSSTTDEHSGDLMGTDGVLRVDPVNVHDSEGLGKFTAGFRGEWVGYECVFNKATGVVQELDDFDLPDGFRELNVVPVGYESSNSCTVRGTKWYRKHFRILPSVCVFGDHIDVEEDTFTSDLADPHCTAFMDGCYALGHAVHDPEAPVYLSPKKIEFGIVHPVDFKSGAPPPQRIIVRFGIHAGVGKIVSDPQIFMEHWEMDYTGGQVVQGGSGFVQGWGSDPLREMSIFEGSWKSLKTGRVHERKSPVKEEQRTLILPHGITISIVAASKGDAYQVQVGWLPDGQDTHRALITQTISSRTGEFMSADYDIETKV